MFTFYLDSLHATMQVSNKSKHTCLGRVCAVARPARSSIADEVFAALGTCGIWSAQECTTVGRWFYVSLVLLVAMMVHCLRKPVDVPGMASTKKAQPRVTTDAHQKSAHDHITVNYLRINLVSCALCATKVVMKIAD